MRARKRRRPPRREVSTGWSQDELVALLLRARYIGSPEHKRGRGRQGQPAPAPRPDASICPDHLLGDLEELTRHLRDALAWGNASAPDLAGPFPRYAWARINGVLCEARLTNATLGE